MIYSEKSKNVIDVTKAPYFADPTGKRDSTAALVRAFDDTLRACVTGLAETERHLLELSENLTEDVYIRRETAKVIDGKMLITFPEVMPDGYVLYFPRGEYLVSDTVTYTFDNLNSQQMENYRCELCRNIHIHGEDRDGTVIRLADNAPGFSGEVERPVLSLNHFFTEDNLYETTNSAQLNTVRDLTVDCGRGNPSAVGIHFISSNCGRIENVTVRGAGSLSGIDIGSSSEGCVRHLKVSGFRYGIRTAYTSPFVYDDVDLSGSSECGLYSTKSTAVFHHATAGDRPLVKHHESPFGRYRFDDRGAKIENDGTSNAVFYAEKTDLFPPFSMPEEPTRPPVGEWAFVDDFGAVGDGVTDSSLAIKRAMRSGAEVVVFGKGSYRIDHAIRVPASVKIIDFMYCDIVAGPEFISGELDAMFLVEEDADTLLTFENLFAEERCYGFFRFIRHAAKRDILLRDFMTQYGAVYYNTVPGSTVYIDDCFMTMATYAQNCGLIRRGYHPVFCSVIPFEFHGQNVYATNINPERADLEVLVDGGRFVADGFKTEGPGTMLRAQNGAKVQLNLVNGGIWHTTIDNSCFEIEDAQLQMTGGLIFYLSKEPEHRVMSVEKKDGKVVRTVSLNDYPMIDDDWGLAWRYKTV